MPLNCNNKKSDDAQESEVEAAMKTILEEGAGAVGTPNQTGVAQNPLDGVVVVMGQAQTSGCDKQTSVAPIKALVLTFLKKVFRCAWCHGW